MWPATLLSGFEKTDRWIFILTCLNCFYYLVKQHYREVFTKKMLCGLKMHFQISLHCWDKNSNFQPFKLFLRKNYPPNTVWAIKKLYLSVPQNMKVAWLTITFYKKSKDAHLWIYMSISSFCATFSEIAESTSKSTWFLIPTTIDYTLIII